MLNNYLFFIKNKIIDHKKHFIFNIVILFIVIFVLIITISFSNFMNVFIESNYNNNYQCRKLFVSYDREKHTEEQAITIISSMPHTPLVSTQDKFNINVEIGIEDNTNYTTEIELVSCNLNTVPQTFNKAKLTEKCIIIPNIFKPSGSDKDIDGKKLIGKQLYMWYNVIDYTPYIKDGSMVHGGRIIDKKKTTFTVIGTYDINEYFEQNNSCYVLQSDIEKISNYNIKYNDKSCFSGLVVICDNYKNMKKVISNLAKNGMYAKPAVTFNTDFINLVIAFGYIVVIIFTILSIVTIFSSIKFDLNKNRTEYALLKCIGYTDKNIFNILLLEQILISSISFIFSCIFAYLTACKINRYFITCFEIMGNYNMHVTFKSLIIGALIGFIIPIIILLLNTLKLRKISPIKGSE